MNKILLWAIVFLGLATAVLTFRLSISEKRVQALEELQAVLISNNNILIAKMEKEHNDKIELIGKFEELESLAKKDPTFDWNADISNSDVVIRLRKNANKIR